MYIKPLDSKITFENKLNLAFDVGKDKLDVYTEFDNQSIQDSFFNKTLIIEQKLSDFQEMAISSGYDGLQIIAEPTGIYHNKLFRSARRMGHKTAIVNPESVHKFKVIESNDAGKTDAKDCRVIFLLAKYGKTLIDRDIQNEYNILRHLHTQLVDLEKAYVSIRCKIYNLLKELFCDYSLSNDFIYTKSGRQLVKRFNANPYKIVNYGYTKFHSRMRKYVPGIFNSTIQKLWQDAKTSVRYLLNPEYILVMETHLNYFWNEFLTIEKMQEEIKNNMLKSYDQLQLSDSNLPFPVKGLVTKISLAKLLAETGPLSDFKSINQLMRYAGLNIRECRSGQYQGKNKISKKGRANLRRILGYIVFPLVKKNAFYGSRYHLKKDNGMSGNKAMVAIMRKFLKMIFGWYNSNEPFDIDRIFLDENNYKKLKESAKV